MAEFLGSNTISNQFLGNKVILRTYKGDNLINEYEPLYNPPSDWSDIRKDCPANSIALYAAHPSDFSSYDNLGFTATVTDGYNVYIDGTQYGTTYTSGTTCSITWSTLDITTGDDITTPSAMKAHKIWIEPATPGNNIAAFKCARVASSGDEEQGILWAHFNLTNDISLDTGFSTSSTAGYKNKLLTSVTAKNNVISLTGIYALSRTFSRCEELEYIANLDGKNRNINISQAFSYCSKIENITIKNINVVGSQYTFENCNSLKKINTNMSFVAGYRTFYNCYNLLNLPSISSFQNDCRDTLTNASSLNNVVLDASSNSSMTVIGCYGSSSHFMGGLKGLRVSSSAPFTYATAPQINVSYTGMDRAALITLFNDLPYNVGYEVVGSPTISDNILSGFTNNDYAKINTSPFSQNNKTEIVIKFIPKEKTNGYILGGLTSGGNGGIYLTVYNDQLRYGIISNKITQVTAAGAYQITDLNVPYYMHFTFEGDTLNWKLGLSTDGENPTYGLQGTATDILTTTYLALGWTNVAGFYLKGDIDLNNTYIKLNDVYWFRGQAARANKPELTITGCTGTADLTQEDRDIVESEKNWKLNY